MHAQEVPAGTVAKAADTILGAGVLGALLLLAVAFIFWLLIKYVANVTERVADAEKSAVRERAMVAEWTRSRAEDTKAIAELTANVRQNTAAVTEMAKAVDRNGAAAEGLRGAVDNVVREAVIIGRRPSTGGMQAVTSTRDERRPLRRED